MEFEPKYQAYMFNDILKIKWYQSVDRMTKRELKILMSAGQLEWWERKYILSKFKSLKSFSL